MLSRGKLHEYRNTMGSVVLRKTLIGVTYRFSNTKGHNHLRRFCKPTKTARWYRQRRRIQLMAEIPSTGPLCYTSLRSCLPGYELGDREVRLGVVFF